MSESRIPVEEHVKNLLKFLYAISPAYNELVQMLFILPQKATTLVKMYPALMEKEDVLIELLGLKHTEKGFVEPSNWNTPIAYHLTSLLHSLFKQLSHPDRRRALLELANLKEEEFREFDPLRAWLEVSMKFLAESNKDVLKVLEATVTKLSGKKLNESVSWEEIKSVVSGVKDFKAHLEVLKRFSLLLWESSSYVYVSECPLLLDVYSDLREKLREILR